MAIIDIAFAPALDARPERMTATTAQLADAPVSRRALWAGRILSTVAVLFLVMDAVMKLLRVPAALTATVALGWPARLVLGIGVLEALLLLLYLVPRTAPLGALLWTGYLGGALAAHLRLGDPLATHVLFPVYVAILLWLGLWLRDASLRRVLPLRGAR